MLVGGLLLLWLLVMALAIGGMVFWIVALVDLLKTSDAVWQAIRNDKTPWIIVVAVAGVIGALLYWFVQRPKLKAVEDSWRALGWRP